MASSSSATHRTRVTLLMTLLMTTVLLTTLDFGSALPLGKTSPGPSIKTRYGQVQGLSLSMPSPLGPVALFLGIPYATPPVGINRFSPTRNPQSWPGTRMADKHGPACPQRFPADLANETQALTSMSKVRRDYLLHVQQTLAKNQSEDCLHLNIYTPHSKSISSYLRTFITKTVTALLPGNQDRVRHPTVCYCRQPIRIYFILKILVFAPIVIRNITE